MERSFFENEKRFDYFSLKLLIKILISNVNCKGRHKAIWKANEKAEYQIEKGLIFPRSKVL